MKYFTLFLLLFVSTNILAGNRDETIQIHKIGQAGNHFDLPVPAVEPDVYYDRDNQEIIIVGTGNLTYYDVEIESLTTWLTVISTQVSGTYDTIDVSSLAAGEYCITITSPTGHEFEGFFDIE